MTNIKRVEEFGVHLRLRMKELFSINTGKGEPGGEKLSLRLGEKHCSYAVTDLSGNELYDLAYCDIQTLNEHTLSAFRSVHSLVILR